MGQRKIEEEEKIRKREEEKRMGEIFEAQWDSGTESDDDEPDDVAFEDDSIEDKKQAAEDFVFDRLDLGLEYFSDSSELTSEDGEEFDDFMGKINNLTIGKEGDHDI